MGHRHAGAIRVAVRTPKSPAVPDPDPQPQPRAVFAAGWLLMLMPSVLAIAVPTMLERKIRHLSGMSSDVIILVILGAAIVLCYALGFLWEKWRWGSVKNFDRALRYGAL